MKHKKVRYLSDFPDLVMLCDGAFKKLLLTININTKMENQVSEFRQKQIDLREKSFTEEFKNNTLLLDVEFDNLEVEVDRLMIYQNGGIMGVAVDLSEHNKEILSKFVKDFDAYNELIDLEYASAKTENQTDLISIIDYHQNVHRQELLYDVEDEVFFYEGSED